MKNNIQLEPTNWLQAYYQHQKLSHHFPFPVEETLQTWCGQNARSFYGDYQSSCYWPKLLKSEIGMPLIAMYLFKENLEF